MGEDLESCHHVPKGWLARIASMVALEITSAQVAIVLAGASLAWQAWTYWHDRRIRVRVTPDWVVYGDMSYSEDRLRALVENRSNFPV